MIKQFTSQVLRYFHTLRHLKPGQTAGRLWAMVKLRMGTPALPSPPISLQGKLHAKIAFCEHDPWNTRADILKGKFCFLHQIESLGKSIDWHPRQKPLLWQFNLHYFQYLFLLKPDEQTCICKAWIADNPPADPVSWHPFPLSLRIIQWCKAGVNDGEIQKSLYQQTAYLFRNMETYHPGNHLLENARALIFAGCFFKDYGEAHRWIEKGVSIYMKETPLQILKDGGHFERSPMYHSLMLEGYLDILNILPDSFNTRTILMDAAQKMSDFLRSMTHPDESIVLFNDSTREIAAHPQVLLAYAKKLLNQEPQQKTVFPDSGYYIHSTPALFCVIDGGVIGPDFLPAHSHADIFSYELSIHKLLFVVDSGVYEYPSGKMRDYVRSTRAHNTVCVDGTDQAECWKSFRVARRFRPYDISFLAEGTSSRFEGFFNGYAKMLGDDILHQRSIRIEAERKSIQVEDLISGKGLHLSESLIHLHPEVSMEIKNNKAYLRRNSVEAVFTAHQGLLSFEDGWYCPEFGLKQKNKVLIVAAHSLPANLSYTLTY
ncbi:MAG: alginate lyase family protein [SAR324 cluster bacterium]|nr:alginate lyase family protein [SAR324 cluster bacterium]